MKTPTSQLQTQIDHFFNDDGNYNLRLIITDNNEDCGLHIESDKDISPLVEQFIEDYIKTFNNNLKDNLDYLKSILFNMFYEEDYDFDYVDDEIQTILTDCSIDTQKELGVKINQLTVDIQDRRTDYSIDGFTF